MKADRFAYILMFCGLILVKKNKATLEESLSLVPLCLEEQDLVVRLIDPQSQA